MDENQTAGNPTDSATTLLEVTTKHLGTALLGIRYNRQVSEWTGKRTGKRTGKGTGKRTGI